MSGKVTVILVLLLGFMLVPQGTAYADGIIIPDPPPGMIHPPMRSLDIKYHYVNTEIRGQIAVTHVDQVFYNPNDWIVEGTYFFPIPKDAAVNEFILWIDGEPVSGEILEAGEARQIYEEIVRNLQDPALLEYAELGAVRARIFPIPPGGERRIELEYTEILKNEGGLIEYSYPLNTEKFSREPIESVRIHVDIESDNPIRAAYSPSHPISLDYESDQVLAIGYEESNVKPDRNFSVLFSVGDTDAIHLMSFQNPDDIADPDGYFLLMIAPRLRVEDAAVPKDVILVLDQSGSMEGEKFTQATTALKYILENLNPEDRFNLVSFSTGTRMFENELQPAAQANDAIEWVDRLSAVGSTDINRALLEAASLVDRERPTYVIFLTDGLPTEGVTDSDQIIRNLEENASSNIRLFAFGVGYDVDTYLLDSLSTENHGVSTYVIPGEPLDEYVSAFYEKISTPIMTDLELDLGNLVVRDLYPSPLPDLFAGSQIIIVGRYQDAEAMDITLKGVVNGQPQEYLFENQPLADNSDHLDFESSLPRIWATRKIGYLLRQIRLNGPNEEVIDQIISLSIRFGIVTPYTSYLVTEPIPLGSSELDRLAEKEMGERLQSASAPSYGQDAVEEAAGQNKLQDASTAMEVPEESYNAIRILGERTFINVNGTWIDTGYDPDVMTTLKVAFLSDDYFALTRAYPSLAAAFSLGEQVIAFGGDAVYQVVPIGDDTDPIELPEDINEPVKHPIQISVLGEDEDDSGSIEDNPESGRQFPPCIKGMIPLVIASLFIRIRRK